MCRAITCPSCQRPSWAGCGAHVEQVLGHVPPEQRCHCAAQAEPDGAGRGGFLQRLLGR